MNGDDDRSGSTPPTSARPATATPPRSSTPCRRSSASRSASGGLFFLAEPLVDPLAVDGTRLPVAFLSVVVVAVGLSFGGAAYLRRNRRRIGLAHAIGGAGWALVAVGTALGSGVVLVAGLAVLLGGCLWLVAGLVAAG